MKNLKFQDAQQIHVSFEGCTNVQASYLTVTAPETSPNTDGIHITSTKNMTISNSNIGTGTRGFSFKITREMTHTNVLIRKQFCVLSR